MMPALAQRSGWQTKTVSPQFVRAKSDNVQVTVQSPVLIAIIQKQDVRLEPVFDKTATANAIPIDHHRHRRQGFCQHDRFVAALTTISQYFSAVGNDDQITALSPVTAAENGHAFASRLQPCRQKSHRWRFTGSANGEVTHADDSTIEPVDRQDSLIIKRIAKVNRQ